LCEKLQCDVPLSPTTLATIAHQIITAFAYFHGERLAHYDIKLKNILLDRYGRPKFADFGLAVRCRASECSNNCGSLHYMSPELLAGCTMDAFACDVWVFGITLYEMATGRKLYTATNARALFQEIVRNNVHMPAHMPSDMTEAIGSILAFDPCMRPTMAQLAQMACFAGKKIRSETSEFTIYWRHLLRIPGSTSQRIRVQKAMP
jgi:serine/threonine protein kinase